MNFDQQWKFEALKIAVMEQLETRGVLDLKTLFPRARDVYSQGYYFELQNWQSLWDLPTTKEGEKKVAEVIRESFVDMALNKDQAKPGFKQCSGCGEMIPEKWKKHAYKKNGELCGYEFER